MKKSNFRLRVNGVNMHVITDAQMYVKDNERPGYKMGRKEFFIRQGYLQERMEFMGETDRAAAADIYREYLSKCKHEKENVRESRKGLSYFEMLVQKHTCA